MFYDVHLCNTIKIKNVITMKKLIMSMLLTVAIGYGLALAQSTQTQTQDKSTTGTMNEQQPGWQKIGEKTIDLSKGHDELAFTTSETFKAIKVKAENAPVNLTDLQLFYDSGEKQDVAIDNPLTANGETPVINLNESDKGLKRIVFDCKPSVSSSYSKDMKSDKTDKDMSNKDMSSTGTGKDKVKVEVWGLRAEK